MQIQCPKCKCTGNIADKLVPDEGRTVGCPKCKERFFIKKLIAPETISDDMIDIGKTAYEPITSQTLPLSGSTSSEVISRTYANARTRLNQPLDSNTGPVRSAEVLPPSHSPNLAKNSRTRNTIIGILCVALLISLFMAFSFADRESIYTSILKYGPYPMKAYAAKKLGLSEDIHAIDSLAEALGNEDPAVVEAAARSLGEIGDERGVDPLIKVWIYSKDEEVANAALLSLVRIAAKYFDKLPDNDNGLFEKIRMAMIDGYKISGMGDDIGIVNTLTPGLEDKEPNIRIVSALLIGNLGSPKAAESLLSIVDDKDLKVRKYVLIALGNTRDPRALEPLLSALNDNDQQIRLAAIKALPSFGDPRVKDSLMQLLSDSNPEIRMACARALGELKDPSTAEALMEAYSTNPPEVQKEILKGLSSVQSPESLDLMIEALNSPETDNQITALNALAKMDDPKAKKAVEDFISDSSRYDKIKYKLQPNVETGLENSRAQENFLGSAKIASLKLYVDWLKDWIHQGGEVNAGFPHDTKYLSGMYEVSDGAVITPLYGAGAVMIIAPKGISFTIKDRGHNQLFYWDSGGSARVEGGFDVPVFKDVKVYLKKLNDPEIDKALTSKEDNK
jgi:predicted Zn finger-like uncharacterized protein